MKTSVAASAAKKKSKRPTRFVWASFRYNRLEEIIEPVCEEQNKDGSITLTKTFVVVKNDKPWSPSDLEEEEFLDLREAYKRFADICFLDFYDQAQCSFYTYDKTGDIVEFKPVDWLTPLNKIAKKLWASNRD